MNSEINLSNYVVTYAQNREDVILSAFFGDIEQGFYVDVGAYEPVLDSVTKYFYERGWHGINVEPNTRLFEKLQADRPRDINLNIGVSNKKGTLEFREYLNGGGLSTVSTDIKKGYEADEERQGMTNVFKDTTIRADTLRHIFTAHKVKTIHFLKIDIEGFEYEALEGNDWEAFRPQVICIEANHIIKDWHGMLEKYRYKLFFNDGLNEYFVDADNSALSQKFAYVEMIIGRDIITHDQYRHLQQLVADLTTTRASLDYTIQKNSKLRQRIAALEHELADSRRLKNQAKGLARALDNVITVRIDNLNKGRYKHQAIVYDKQASAISLLDLAHVTDSQTYSQNKLRLKKLAYDALKPTYGLGRRASRKLARGAYRSLRVGKRIIKGRSS